MSFERLSLVLLALTGCVQSSGTGDPPGDVNVATIDGEAVTIDSVTMLRGTAEEYGPGRRVFVSVVVGDLVINVHLGSLAPGAQDVLPFSSPDVGANSGADSEIAHVGVAGTVSVVEGSGVAGKPLQVEIDGLVLREACSGSEIVVDRAVLRADVTVNDDFLDDPSFDVAAAGHVEGTILHPTLGELPYIGIAGTSKFTRTSGDVLWLVSTGDACIERRFVFTLGLAPVDVVDGFIDFSIAGNPSAALLNEANDAGTGFAARTVADSGVVILEDPLAVDEPGAVARGTLNGMVFTFIDENDEALPGDPIEVAAASFRTVMGAP